MKILFSKNKKWYPKRLMSRFNSKLLSHPVPQFVKEYFGEGRDLAISHKTAVFKRYEALPSDPVEMPYDIII